MMFDKVLMGSIQVGWFRTTFHLDFPEGLDVPVSLSFADTPGAYRGTSNFLSRKNTCIHTIIAQLYINGWQMGKRAANLGPQNIFVIQPGILNIHGTNTLALSLWSMGTEAADMSIPSLELILTRVYSGGLGPIKQDNPGWSDRYAW